MTTPTLKVVVVGDGAVGKTCLLMSYVNQIFPTEYVPTVFENYNLSVELEGTNYDVGLFDTAGQEAYNQLRTFAYANAHVFLACFSVTSRISFANISQKWVPELRRNMPKTPIILVGTQSDLRDDSDALATLQKKREQPVSQASAQNCVDDLALVRYVECSAKTRVGVDDVFKEALAVAINPHPEISGSSCPCCSIL